MDDARKEELLARLLDLQATIAMRQPFPASLTIMEVTCELVMYDSELDPPDEIRHTSPCIIEQARTFLAQQEGDK